MKEKTITRDYLQQNPNHIFVFGDNTTRKGTGGAAILRDEPNTYGFITQNLPSRHPGSRYRPTEYEPIYEDEIKKLQSEIGSNPGKVFLISRIGGGLANEYGIWEQVIEPRIRRDLAGFTNVEFLWSDDISDEEQDELQARFLKDTGIHVNKDTIVKYASWLQNQVVRLEAKIDRLKGINGKRT